MTPLVFCDTETTGLDRAHDEIWDFAAIRQDTDVILGEKYQRGTFYHAYFEHDTDKVKRLPEPFRVDHDARYDPDAALNRNDAAKFILDVFRPGENGEKPHLVGAVPDFDAAFMTRLLYQQLAARPPWHYHIIDVEALVVGYLAGVDSTGMPNAGLPPLPWRSDDLSMAIGVPPPASSDRHTATGDALWVARLWQAIIGRGYGSTRIVPPAESKGPLPNGDQREDHPVEQVQPEESGQAT